MRKRPHRPANLPQGWQLGLSALLGLLLALGLIAGMNLRLRPAVLAVAETKLSNQMTREVLAAVQTQLAQTPVTYDQLVHLNLDENGRIRALQADMPALSTVQISAVQQVIAALGSSLAEETIRIPVGTVTGSTLLSGRGPGIPVRVLYEGSASARYENELESAGINQTVHRIVLCIQVQAELLLPGGAHPCETEVRIPLAETVLLGDVPENYTYFSQFDTAEDAAGAYFDFGAGQ